MPLEIREIVIKAQIEEPLASTSKEAKFSSEKLAELKAEIVDTIIEKMEEKLWKILKP